MATCTLTVRKFNKKALKTPRKQRFSCEQMDGVIALTTGSGTTFLYRALGKIPIPQKYEVTQSVSQINALCNQCCTSGGSGNP